MSRAMLTSMFLTAGVAAASTAEAQEPTIHWHAMAGYSEPVGTTSNVLQGGYLVGGGFSVAPSRDSPLDFRFDVSYSAHNATNDLLNANQQTTNLEIDNGTGSFLTATGNVEYHVPIAYGVRAYGIAGIGAYRARLEFTQAVPFGDYFCDPFSGFCEAGSDAVVASRSVTKFGWNAGVGIEFALPYGQSWFIEARYHRISTDTPTEYVPIEVGYRF
jgi:opacity protein-like surface antigen